MGEPLSNSPKKEQGECLTIAGDPEVVEPCMFGNGMYLSIFYWFWYEMDISTGIYEEQVSEEIYPDLDEEEDTRMDDSTENH